MAKTISNLAVTLSVNSSNMAAGMAAGGKSVDGFAARVTSANAAIAGMTAGLASFGLNAAASGIGTLAGGIADLAKKGISLAATAEQNAISFEVMLGSAAEAKTVLADLAKFAASTPYGSAEVIDAGRQLIAFGVAGKDVQSTLRQLGDVASGIGAPIGEIAYLFGTIGTQGKAMTQDLNQFAGRGIPIYSALAKVMGTNEAGIRKLAEAGEVSFEKIEAAFKGMTGEGGKFGGLMQRQSQSMAGQWAALGDAVDANLTKLAAGALSAIDIKAGIESISVAVQALADVGLSSVQAGFDNSTISAKSFGEVAVNSIEAVALAGAHLADTAQSIGTGFQGLSAKFAGMAASAVSWIDMEKHQWAQDMYISAMRDYSLATKAAQATFDASAAVQEKIAAVRERMAQLQAPVSTGFDAGGGGDVDPIVAQADAAAAAVTGKFRAMTATTAGMIGQVMQANMAGIQKNSDAAADKLAKMADDARQLAEQLKAPWEKLGDEIDRVAKLEAAGLLDPGTAEKAIAAAVGDSPAGRNQPRELAAR